MKPQLYFAFCLSDDCFFILPAAFLAAMIFYFLFTFSQLPFPIKLRAGVALPGIGPLSFDWPYFRKWGGSDEGEVREFACAKKALTTK
jgi:hypothetical protein